MFGNKEREKEDWAIIERLLEIIETQAETIRKCCCKAHKVTLIYNFSNNKNTTTMADVTLVLGGANETGTPSLIDNKTGQPVTGTVTYSNVQALVADQTIATVSVDPSTGIATATPVAVGSTTVTITATVSYTDSNGQPVTGPLSTVSMNIVVTTAADGVTLVYTWA